jgi:hypothetical protein
VPIALFPERTLPVTAKAASLPRTISPLRYLDVAVVVLGAVPALLLGAPALGYIVGGAGWILQRLLQNVDQRFISHRVHDPLRVAGANLAEAFGRIWLLVAAIVVAAVVGNHHDGLCAAILIFAAYSIAFAIRLFEGAAGVLATASVNSEVKQ